jgi:hypothetical protein
MPITVTWDNPEQTIIRLTFEGRWTWDEHRATANHISDLLRDVNAPVDLIVDFHSCHVPDNAIRYTESGTAFFWHPQARLTVLVGVQGFIRTLLMLFIQTYPQWAHQFLFAGTIEHAYEVLARQQMARAAEGSGAVSDLTTRQLEP